MDMKGAGLGKAPSVYGFLQQASAISQNYYPERLGKLYVINAPWGFSSIFAIVKKFLDPVTVAKIHVYGGSYEKDLLAQIPAGATVLGSHWWVLSMGVVLRVAHFNNS